MLNNTTWLKDPQVLLATYSASANSGHDTYTTAVLILEGIVVLLLLLLLRILSLRTNGGLTQVCRLLKGSGTETTDFPTAEHVSAIRDIVGGFVEDVLDGRLNDEQPGSLINTDCEKRKVLDSPLHEQ